MSSIEILPPEVLLEIFGYLSLEELLNNVQQVCTSWRELVQHSSLWEDFVYSPTMYTTYLDVIKFIEKCPMLKHIHFYFRAFQCPGNLEEVMKAAIKNCCDMCTFHVEFDNGNCFTLSHINSLFEAFPNLETFGITIDCPDAIQIVDRVSKSTKLKKLIVSGGSYIDGLFQPLIDGCSSLNSLRISKAIIPETDQLWILQNMKDRLSHIEFSSDQAATQQVIEVFSTFTKLEELKLTHLERSGPLNFLPLANVRTLRRFTFISDTQKKASLDTFYDAMFCNPTSGLDTLFDALCCNSTSGLDTLFDALFCNPFPLLQDLTILIFSSQSNRAVVNDICLCYPNMRSVSLRYTLSDNKKDNFEEMGRLQQLERFAYHVSSSITDDDTEHFARCRKLKHLDLSHCIRLTDKTVANLVNCNLLETLNLTNCSLTGQSLDIFSEHWTKLITLVVYGINADEKELYALEDRRPSLKVNYYT